MDFEGGRSTGNGLRGYCVNGWVLLFMQVLRQRFVKGH
jgi:hypothetical protein